MILWIPIALIVAVLMDFWAAFLHERFWHASLWRFHLSHHTERKGLFELNDAFSLVHAPVSIVLTVWGSSGPGTTETARAVAFGIGIGMATFGMGYLLIHDGVVHGRLPLRFLRALPYVRTIVRAHKVHHTGVRGGAPYGLFFGPWELARTLRRRPESTQAETSGSEAADP
jgi:beta-carotene 3-hydroxylase